MRRIHWSANASRRVRALLTCGILLTTGVLGTTALWTTSAATTSGTFTTASVEIKANGDAPTHTFTFPDTLTPGQRTAYVVDVQNTGSVAFTYSVAVSSANAVGQAMTLRAVANGTVSGRTCSGGTQIVASQAITGSTVTFTSDRGPLAAGSGVEALCFELFLSLTAPASLLNSPTGSVTLTFTATGPP